MTDRHVTDAEMWEVMVILPPGSTEKETFRLMAREIQERRETEEQKDMNDNKPNNQYLSNRTIELEAQLKENRRKDQIADRLIHEVVNKHSQEELEILVHLINEKFHGED